MIEGKRVLLMGQQVVQPLNQLFKTYTDGIRHNEGQEAHIYEGPHASLVPKKTNQLTN